MEWIKTILPLFGVLLGWILSERGKIFADRRQDKRKLKKLLFFLLELRFYFSRDLSIKVDIDKCIAIFQNKMAKKLGIGKDAPELNLGSDTWKALIEQVILKLKPQDDKFEFLSKNIDRIIIELSAIYPILAYELNGKHNVKEQLKKVDDYLNEIKSLTNEIPLDFKEWINPKLTTDLLNDLDESIRKIAKKIGKKTQADSKFKIERMSFENNDNEMKEFMDEYLEEVFNNISLINKNQSTQTV